MNLEALALAVDERLHTPAADRRNGRLYAVRVTSDPHGPGDDEPPPSCPAAGVVLELLAEGEARTLPQRIRPPEGLQAIALASGVWAAPMEDDGPGLPPSRHPQRRRAHLTVIIGTEAEHDGVGVSVVRYNDGAPTVLRGGIGLVHQRMLRCWSRRPDGPWATRRPPAAAA